MKNVYFRWDFTYLVHFFAPLLPIMYLLQMYAK